MSKFMVNAGDLSEFPGRLEDELHVPQNSMQNYACVSCDRVNNSKSQARGASRCEFNSIQINAGSFTLLFCDSNKSNCSEKDLSDSRILNLLGSEKDTVRIFDLSRRDLQFVLVA